MKPKALHHGYRFPAAIISQALRWHFRFPPSPRVIEEPRFERGVIASYETTLRWYDKFGAALAGRVKAAQRQRGRTAHPAPMSVNLRGEPWLLWRAVGEHGAEPDVLPRKRPDKAAAKRFFQRVLCSFPAPREIVTGPLRSYPAAKAGIPALATVRQVFVKAAARVNDRAENSHQRIRKRERRMRGFRDPKRARAFLTSFGPIRSRAEHSHRPARVREKAMRRFKSEVQIGGSTAAIRLGACRGVQPCHGLPLSSRCET
ncbi:IS6 family transposase [Burkholderia plantarii]|nr:DDE-type integrase/transposase/recombinase [Burkholderia plantarii]ALK34947.1 IS element transposase [Burkholderia plantarii]GLZ18600.1 IS6 family transposase [Burkholderia plantarii]